MGRLLENELTKILIDTMDEFREFQILDQFLDLVGIKLLNPKLVTARFENFKFFDQDELDGRREIDGVIETDSALIFIEAKRGNNKQNKDQLIEEYRIGSSRAKQKKIQFFLIAIDENITEPKVIETVRKSTYAKVKREQIKWVSWHQITKMLSSILESTKFDNLVLKRIFEKRVSCYKNQGFKSFEGFQKEKVSCISRSFDILDAFDSVSKEISNLVKELQVYLVDYGISRVYKESEQWRKIQGKKKKLKIRRVHLYWEYFSEGIGNRKTTLVRSYTFPFADSHWPYDLSKDTVPYFLFLRFDFESKKVAIGYSISRAKLVKEFLTEEKKVHKAIKQFSFFQRKPLLIYSSKIFPDGRKASEVKQEDLHELKKSSSIEFQYQLDLTQKDLLSKVKDFFINIHDFVVSTDLVPKPEPDTQQIEIDDTLSDDDSSGEEV